MGFHREKPHPLGNEYHTTASCKKNIFQIELVEGKDKKTEGPYYEYKFEHEFGSRNTELAFRMAEPLWEYVGDVIMESGFGYMGHQQSSLKIEEFNHDYHQEEFPPAKENRGTRGN